jgi:hypothetical protein
LPGGGESSRGSKPEVCMRAYLVFTGSGPILILTTFPSVTDPRLVEKLKAKGIRKFLAYEVPLARTRELYGAPFEVVAADLVGREDVRVLDFNGHHIFANFSLRELGEAISYEEPA